MISVYKTRYKSVEHCELFGACVSKFDNPTVMIDVCVIVCNGATSKLQSA